MAGRRSIRRLYDAFPVLGLTGITVASTSLGFTESVSIARTWWGSSLEESFSPDADLSTKESLTTSSDSTDSEAGTFGAFSSVKLQT